VQCCRLLGFAVDILRSNVTDGYDQVIATESRTRAIFRQNNSAQRFFQITDTYFGDYVTHSDYVVTFPKRKNRIKRRSFQERRNKDI